MHYNDVSDYIGLANLIEQAREQASEMQCGEDEDATFAQYKALLVSVMNVGAKIVDLSPAIAANPEEFKAAAASYILDLVPLPF